MWFNNKFFQYVTATILLLSILYLIILLQPIFSVIFTFLITLVLPLMFAGLLFFILKPLRDNLEKRDIPRMHAIFLIYLFIVIVIMISMTYLWPFFYAQLIELSHAPAVTAEEVKEKTLDIMQLFNFAHYSTAELSNILNTFLYQVTNWLTTDLLKTIGKITQIASFIIFTPFILFYLLKDSDTFFNGIVQFTPHDYKKIVKKILNDVTNILMVYISGQFLVAFILGTLMFIGYSIIQLPFAFLMAILAFVFAMIPFIGAIIATLPALLVALTVDPFMAIKVLIVVTIVHTLDSNLISPNILGSRLNIHPLGIILILLACGTLYGLLGLLLATPIYAVLKVILTDLYEEQEQLTSSNK